MGRSKCILRYAAYWIMLFASTGVAFCDGPPPVTVPVHDIFGRDISASGLILTDWEGYMANPAIEFTVLPPPGTAFPANATITSPEPRLYFNLPSDAGEKGPRKQLQFATDAPAPVSVAIFPARQKKKLDTFLDIQVIDAKYKRWRLKLPIHVIFTEGHDPSATFPIAVDFSQDQTGFYSDTIHQETFRQAVKDWDFYLEDMHVSPVAARSEKTAIFERDGFKKSHLVTNTNAYTGFLLYTYGIAGPEMRSGGEPSMDGEFQAIGTEKLPIKRSGGVEVEIDGNYNRLGWLPPLEDDEWWKATNLGNVRNDLYSIQHHEMAHSLFFNPTNAKFPRGGVIKSDAIEAYLGTDVRVDSSDHFNGFIDPASLHGAFGNEYHGQVPYGRWLITKLDLLCIEAIGYKLRKVDALAPLAIHSDPMPVAFLGRPYQASLKAEGGIPTYDWEVAGGSLPPGLSINSFTGAISGTPAKLGAAAFTIRLRDNTKNARGVSQNLTIIVNAQ